MHKIDAKMQLVQYQTKATQMYTLKMCLQQNTAVNYV